MSEVKGDLPRIYTVLPDEIRDMHPHGQWVLNTQGQIINFACDVDDDRLPVLRPWVDKLAAFTRSDDDVMEYESPHLPGVCYLTRVAAQHIISTMPAWSRKVMPRNREGGPATILDHGTNLPVLRKVRN